MATYYINNTPAGPGNDSNAGTSEATAWLTKAKFDATAVSNDLGYFKGNTGVDYTTAIGASSTYSANVDYMIYPSDEGISPSLYPKFVFNQTSNFVLTQNGNNYFHKIILNPIQSATGTTLCWNWGTAASTYKSFNYCNFLFNNTVNVTSATVTCNTGGITYYKTNMDFNNGAYTFNLSASAGGGQDLVDCSLYGNVHNRTSGTLYNLIGATGRRCSFSGESNATTILTRRSIVSVSQNFASNVILVKATDGNINAIAVPNNPDTTGSIHDNIIYFHTKVTGDTYAYGSSTTITAGTPVGAFGNNLIVAATAIFQPTDGASASTKFPDITSATNPFISIVPTNTDYCKLDPTNGTAAKAASIFSLVDIGRFQSLGAGAAYLNITDVKIGVDRGDGNIGTYDGSDRHTDPGIANVRTGQAYKSNSLTNNRTGTAAIPTASQVLDGISVDATVGNVTLPTASQVIIHPITGNVSYGANGTQYTGNFLVPSPAFVIDTQGTYGANGTELTANYLVIDPNYYLNSGPGYGQAGALIGLATLPDNTYVHISQTYGIFGSEVEGTLTSPSAANVLTGSGTYGANGTEFTPSLSPDYPAAANVAANDTTNGVTGLIPLSAIKETSSAGTLPLNKIAPSQGGSYLGQESNTSLTAAKIAIGEIITNLGNSITGTYAATERYSEVDLAQVVAGYDWRYNSLTNNREGTRTAIYNLLNVSLVKFGTDRGDGQLGTDIGADFNTALIASQVKLGEVINNLNTSITGTYDAIERYTELPEDKVENNYAYRYNSLVNNKEGTLVGGSVDPKYILYPLGTLGQINTSNMDISQQIRNQFLNVLELNLTDYRPLDYLEDLTKNSFRQNSKRYGIRQLNLNPIVGSEGVIGREIIERSFEVVLTTDFVNNNTSDEKARSSKDAIIETAEKIRRLINNTNFGTFKNARIVRNIVEDTIEIDNENKVVVARISLSVQVKLPRT